MKTPPCSPVRSQRPEPPPRCRSFRPTPTPFTGSTTEWSGGSGAKRWRRHNGEGGGCATRPWSPSHWQPSTVSSTSRRRPNRLGCEPCRGIVHDRDNPVSAGRQHVRDAVVHHVDSSARSRRACRWGLPTARRPSARTARATAGHFRTPPGAHHRAGCPRRPARRATSPYETTSPGAKSAITALMCSCSSVMDAGDVGGGGDDTASPCRLLVLGLLVCAPVRTSKPSTTEGGRGRRRHQSNS